MSAELINVAIADDHKIFRDGIKMALKDKDKRFYVSWKRLQKVYLKNFLRKNTHTQS